MKKQRMKRGHEVCSHKWTDPLKAVTVHEVLGNGGDAMQGDWTVLSAVVEVNINYLCRKDGKFAIYTRRGVGSSIDDVSYMDSSIVTMAEEDANLLLEVQMLGKDGAQ